MLIEGKLAGLIVNLDPSIYRNYIWEFEKAQPMFYLQLKKHFMELYTPNYCSGSIYPIHYKVANKIINSR